MNTRPRPALVTLAIGPNLPWIEQTEPYRQAYAARHGFDYIRLTTPRIKRWVNLFKPHLNLHLEKFQLFDLFPQYSRLLYVDADILLHPRAPNFLNFVTPERLGVVFEDVYHEAPKRRQEWERAQRRLGPLPTPPAGYFNAGLLVMSPIHQELFRLQGRRLAAGRWPDQNTLNYYAARLHVPLHPLPAHCNLMPAANEAFFDPELRRRAWAIHYAGQSAKALIADDVTYFQQLAGAVG